MTAPSLVGLVLLGLAAPPGDPDAWIARLGAPRYPDRERAAGALTEIGTPALPALGRAARADRDPEIRARAARLIGAIERRRLTRPTRLELDFRDRPLPGAVADLAGRSGINVTVDPAADLAWQSRRVSVQAAGPVPFWDALDRLCQAGGLRPAAAGGGGGGGPGRRGELIRLVPGPPDPAPTAYSGPFRARLIGLRRQPLELGGGLLHARLELVGEPGLFPGPAGPLKILTAVDDLGQSMLPPRSADGFPPAPAGLKRGDGPPALQYLFPLRLPARPGRRIEHLRGVAAISVSARRPDSMVAIPLEDSTGKVFAVGDATVRIDQVLPWPGGAGLKVGLSIARGVATPEPIPLLPDSRDPNRGRIEVVDARGRPCDWGPLRRRPWFGEEVIELRLAPGPDGSPPAEFRIFDLIEDVAEVPFAFSRVPLP